MNFARVDCDLLIKYCFLWEILWESQFSLTEMKCSIFYFIISFIVVFANGKIMTLVSLCVLILLYYKFLLKNIIFQFNNFSPKYEKFRFYNIYYLVLYKGCYIKINTYLYAHFINKRKWIRQAGSPQRMAIGKNPYEYKNIFF